MPVAFASNAAKRLRSKVGDANVVVKDVLGSTVIEKLTCRTAVGFWQWNQSALAARGSVLRAGRRATPTLTSGRNSRFCPRLCLLAGLAALIAQNSGAAPAVVLPLFALSYICGAWDAAGESFERLRHGELEIHFLMLAVAFGAALDRRMERRRAPLVFLLRLGRDGTFRRRAHATRDRRAPPRRAQDRDRARGRSKKSNDRSNRSRPECRCACARANKCRSTSA